MTHRPPLWKDLLDMGRVSNFPTLLSQSIFAIGILPGKNLHFATPFLAGLLLLCCFFLYSGSCLLGDWADAKTDQQLKPHAPLPSGRISPYKILLLGLFCLSIPLLAALFLPLGSSVRLCFFFLLFFSSFYAFFHKLFPHISPWVMASCRVLFVLLFLLFFHHSSTFLTSFFILSCLISLFLFTLYLSYLAEKKRLPPSRFIFFFILPIPAILSAQASGLWISLALFYSLYALWLLFTVFFKKSSQAIPSLLATFCLLDATLLAPQGGMASSLCLLCFFLCLYLQRIARAS